MARQFLTRSTDDADDHIMSNIASREAELACYDANVQSYTDQLKAMESDEAVIAGWPEKLNTFKGKSNEQIIALGASEEDAAIASKLNWYDRLTTLVFTEKAEREKSEKAYDALLAQLPEGPRRDEAFARWQAKQKS